MTHRWRVMSKKRTRDLQTPRDMSAETRRVLGIDGDALIGTDKQFGTSNTQILDVLGGQMLVWSRQATNTEAAPVFGACDTTKSILLFNKLYGQSITVPVKQGKEGETEWFHLFSAFYSRVRRERLDPTKFVYSPPYGGLKEVPDPQKQGSTTLVPRPLVMCSNTLDVMVFASSDWGWRALLYENKGSDDPNPTGIVALEAWLFRLEDHEVQSQRTGKKHIVKQAVDMDDMEEYGRRFQAMVEFANQRAILPSTPIIQDVSETSGAFQRTPTVTDADADDTPMDDK